MATTTENRPDLGTARSEVCQNMAIPYIMFYKPLSICDMTLFELLISTWQNQRCPHQKNGKLWVPLSDKLLNLGVPPPKESPILNCNI